MCRTCRSHAPDGGRFLGSTFDASCLYRFNAVQRMLRAEGLGTAAISAHCDAQKDRYLIANPLPDMALISQPQARFLAFQADTAPQPYAALNGKGLVTDLRGDVLRIGFGLYQDAADVDALRLAAIN